MVELLNPKDDKAYCDSIRNTFIEIAARINICMSKTSSAIQPLNNPTELSATLKIGFIEAIENMFKTLDYSHSINVLSRLTKQIKLGRA